MKKLSDRWMYYCGLLATFHNVEIDDLKHIQNLIDAEEQGLLAKVVHGEWEYKWFDSICSVCGFLNKAELVTRLRNDWPYCPKCGAKMDGKEEGAV